MKILPIKWVSKYFFSHVSIPKEFNKNFKRQTLTVAIHSNALYVEDSKVTTLVIYCMDFVLVSCCLNIAKTIKNQLMQVKNIRTRHH